jgi:predicted SprT family Zn-dependent metalloprotease
MSKKQDDSLKRVISKYIVHLHYYQGNNKIKIKLKGFKDLIFTFTKCKS